MKKILWVKFGWSEFYRGGPINGNFPFVTDGGEGHEALNFAPAPDGTYYCYIPPQGPHAAKPWNNDPVGWTVVCLAKNPEHKGIHIVGWFENATLAGKYLPRPGIKANGAVTQDGGGDCLSYSISAPVAYLVPLEFRSHPFSHTSVRQGKYSFLAGPGVSVTPNKQEVLTIIEEQLHLLRQNAIENPDPNSAPDIENDEIDPLGGFGGPEHRKAVEVAAVEAVVRQIISQGYSCKSVEKDNVGFDLLASRKDDSEVLHIEVKGTAGEQQQFFMTSNEYGYRLTPEWRLAMVTKALKDPRIHFYTIQEYAAYFEVKPIVWKGRKKTDAL